VLIGKVCVLEVVATSEGGTQEHRVVDEINNERNHIIEWTLATTDGSNTTLCARRLTDGLDPPSSSTVFAQQTLQRTCRRHGGGFQARVRTARSI
jgi:hypothetical protein